MLFCRLLAVKQMAADWNVPPFAFLFFISLSHSILCPPQAQAQPQSQAQSQAQAQVAGPSLWRGGEHCSC